MSGDLSVLGQTPYHDKSSSFVLPFSGSGGVFGLSLRSFSFLTSVFSFPGGESAVDLAGGKLQRKTGSEKKYPEPPLVAKYLFLAADGNSPHSGLLYRLARLGWAFFLQKPHRFPFHPISHKQFEVDASSPPPRHFLHPSAGRKAQREAK